MAELYTLQGVEIFASGTWNGNTYTEKDLDEIVRAFNETGLKPPLKLGHDERQILANNSGMPALGWVKNVYRKGKKLLADIVDVPKRIYEAIKRGAYKKVSSEIFVNYTHNNKVYPYALKAVALLGADVPAVTSLADVEALYTAQGQKYITFTQEVNMKTFQEGIPDDDNENEKKPAKKRKQPTREEIENSLNALVKHSQEGTIPSLKKYQGNIQSIIDAWDEWAGSFTECVNQLRGKEGIDDPEALCAWLHKEAEGVWPAEHSEENPEIKTDKKKKEEEEQEMTQIHTLKQKIRELEDELEKERRIRIHKENEMWLKDHENKIFPYEKKYFQYLLDVLSETKAEIRMFEEGKQKLSPYAVVCELIRNRPDISMFSESLKVESEEDDPVALAKRKMKEEGIKTFEQAYRAVLEERPELKKLYHGKQ